MNDIDSPNDEHRHVDVGIDVHSLGDGVQEWKLQDMMFSEPNVTVHDKEQNVDEVRLKQEAELEGRLSGQTSFSGWIARNFAPSVPVNNVHNIHPVV